MEAKSLQEVLTENGAAVIQTVGVSMEPLLHARESTVLLRKKDGLCRKNDVVLYIRPDGRYTLHRLVKAGPEWLTQGDHQLCTERVCEEWIIGVMKGYHSHPSSRSAPFTAPAAKCMSWHSPCCGYGCASGDASGGSAAERRKQYEV